MALAVLSIAISGPFLDGYEVAFDHLMLLKKRTLGGLWSPQMGPRIRMGAGHVKYFFSLQKMHRTRSRTDFKVIIGSAFLLLFFCGIRV